MSRILIVDDDRDIARILKFRLQRQGYECFVANDGQEALTQIDAHHPDLVLLDVMMPRMDGLTACREIRKRNAWSRIPVILLTAKGDTTDKVTGIKEGADDYIVKPFDFEELQARIEMILRRTQETIGANPLTGLPGNQVIRKRIEAAIASGKPFAACYADLDYFKAFNDEYGFEAGDRIIKCVAEILDEVVHAGDPEGFVGHIGGDDFLFLVELNASEPCCQQIIERFDAGIPEFYRDDHRARGYIESINRQGERVQFPLMTISIGVVPCEPGVLEDPKEIANRAAEMKKFAKGHRGSTYEVDRRIAGLQPGEGSGSGSVGPPASESPGAGAA